MKTQSRLNIAIKFITAAAAFFSLTATAQLASFPGAQGFGTTTPGGRAGKIIKVTSLNNEGPGTLREALEESGARTIIFAIEGRIRLKSQIKITNPYVTLAGQTAPGDGVVVSGARITVQTHDVIIRGMKIRAGDEADGDTPRSRDNLSVGTGAENVVIDSNSFTWGIDESLAIWGSASNIALTNNIIAESLENSIHIDEGKSSPAPHSMGALFGSSKRDRAPNRVTFAKNLLASNRHRNPFIKSATEMEIVNNYVTNYGAAHQGLRIGGADVYTEVTVKGNYYEDGRNTHRKESRAPFHISAPADVFLNDNFIQYHPMNSYRGDKSAITSRETFATSGLKVRRSQDVKALVLSKAGARRLGSLDIVDRRIVSEVEEGTTMIIDSQKQKGGYEVYTFTGATSKDSDKDGMPDWFEIQYGYDRNLNDANLDRDGDGYTNIEEYINGMLDGVFDTPAQQTPEDDPEDTDSSNQTFRIEAEDMNLTSGFKAQSNKAASNGSWIQVKGSGVARYTFQDTAGVYKLTLGYFDEQDGVSRMQVLVNSQPVSTFNWDKNLGSRLANSKTKTTKELASIQLNPGDVIELIGQSDRSEPLRTDYLDFEFIEAAVSESNKKAYSIEAENLNLESGYSVQRNAAASGKEMISTRSRGVASFSHGSGSGLFELKITYFDENDGKAQMQIKQNGKVIDNWRWTQSTASKLATKSTKRVRRIQIDLSNGDSIQLIGTSNKGEPARLDKIEMTPKY
ncbi:MAG: hypothetical protein HRT45_07780 [Bdellovibrionales bacterium]|nr:hypothetical protein [Bdellovibrionales bacterium]